MRHRTAEHPTRPAKGSRDSLYAYLRPVSTAVDIIQRAYRPHVRVPRKKGRSMLAILEPLALQVDGVTSPDVTRRLAAGEKDQVSCLL